MPPYYPPDPNQFPDQYYNGNSYYDQYNQYQYNAPPPNQQQQQRSHVPPPYPQMQNNTQSHQNYMSPQQPQYQFQHSIPQQYAQMMNSQQFQYNQQQPPLQQQQQPPPPQQQHQYPPQYQAQLVQPQQQYYQPSSSHSSMPIQQPVQANRALQTVQPNLARPQATAKPPPSPEPEPEEPDYAILLLSLADEYLEAASKSSIRSEEYFKLTATALGCMESVLNNFKLPPLREAQLSLRYTHILLNETENYDLAETVLTRMVELCERMKFLDLKYAAQLLLAQVLHHSSPRAALKDLQGRIEDTEAYRHSAWEYAFRLQHVIFLASSGTSNGLHSAITRLEKLDAVAQKNNDHAMYAFVAVVTALTHLKAAGGDSVAASQQALAKARAMQLNPDVSENPQLMIMSEFVDLCCQIKNLDTTQSEQKRKQMQANLYKLLESELWRKDGTMQIPLNSASLRGVQLQESGVVSERHGRHFLTFTWLPKDDVEDLGYLLSGISAAFKNAGEGGKAEKFLDVGLDVLQDFMKDKRQINNAGDALHNRRRILECHFVIERAFLQCSKGQWEKAEISVRTVQTIAQELGNKFPTDMGLIVTYLDGAINQGRGNLTEALKIFTVPSLRVQPHNLTSASKAAGQPQKQTEVARDLSVLASINTAFMIQEPSHPQHFRLQQLINVLDQYVHNCSNQIIQAAYNFVLANLPNNTIIKTKKHLSDTLTAAQHVHNAQITTLCLVSMQEKFFRGVVGDQAIKCARAASHQARRVNEPMWIAVATGLEAECLQLHGMGEEAAKKQAESDKMRSLLPENVHIAGN